MSKVLTGNETVSIVGNFAKSKATLKEIASFAVVDSGVTEEFVTEAVKPKADKVYVDAELSKKANASALNKAGVGLGNVDNTSDANKPVSTAQKTALGLKADKTYVDNTLKLKFDIPTNEVPKDGATLIFMNGKWEIANPKPM